MFLYKSQSTVCFEESSNNFSVKFGFDVIGCAFVKLFGFSSGKDMCVYVLLHYAELQGNLPTYNAVNQNATCLENSVSSVWFLVAFSSRNMSILRQVSDYLHINSMEGNHYNELDICLSPQQTRSQIDLFNHYHHYPSFTPCTEDYTSSSILGWHHKAEYVVQ